MRRTIRWLYRALPLGVWLLVAATPIIIFTPAPWSLFGLALALGGTLHWVSEHIEDSYREEEENRVDPWRFR